VLFLATLGFASPGYLRWIPIVAVLALVAIWLTVADRRRRAATFRNLSSPMRQLVMRI